MATPIIETIAAEIETTIAGITTGAGYNQTLDPLRPKRNDFYLEAPVDLKALVVQADDDVADFQAIGTETWRQTFVIVVFVIDSDTETASIDTRINQVKSDIRKAIFVDTTRSGNAIDTILAGAVKFDDGEGATGCAVYFDVLYRTVEGDPYTLS